MQYRMKYILFLSACLSVGVLAGCTMPWNTSTTSTAQIQETYWSEYYQTQCNKNVWGEDTAEQVTAYYQTNYGITIIAVEFVDAADDFIACSACGCPTGTLVKVQTNFEDRLKLLELGFVHEGDAAPVVSDTTNVNSNTTVSLDTPPDTNTNESVATEVTTTNTNSTVTEEPAIPVNDVTTTTDTVPTELTSEDLLLQETVERVQKALTNYYSEHNNYPEKLDQLGEDFGDLTGINYTPIGTVPSTYYDLTVDYSTGKVTVNP